MATINVTTLSDVVNAGDGVTSLREALTEAAGAAGADSIVFDPSLTGTITLDHALGALAVNSDVSIDGDNTGDGKADITIDAARSSSTLTEAEFNRVIDVTSGTSTLHALTITGGRALTGGGIQIEVGATLTIENSTITGNYVSTAGASTAVAGGGISNAGTLTITASAIYGNEARAGSTQNATGGGISNTGTLTVSDTTIANNFAAGGGSTIPTTLGKALGAGIGSTSGAVTLDNVTLTGNVAQYPVTALGGLGSGATASFGGVYSTSGTMTISDTIIAGNLVKASNGVGVASEVSTGITYQGLNIVGIGTDTNADDQVIQVSKIAGLFATLADAGGATGAAGLLMDSGGAVQTVALRNDRYNPALDAASAGSGTTDAIGNVAHDDANIANRDTSARDLGAVELTVDTAANSPPSMNGDRIAAMGEGKTYYLKQADLYFTDADVFDDESNITFTVSNKTNGTVKLNGTASNTFTAYQLRTGQVSFVHNGSETVAAGFDVTVDDGNEDASTPVASRFNFTVSKINDAPKLTKLIPDVILKLHTDHSIGVAGNFTDAEGPLTFTGKLSNGKALPNWIKVSSDGTVSMTPPDNVSGKFAITITAKDSGGRTATDTFNFTLPAKSAELSGDKFTGTGSGNIINAGNGNNSVDSADGNDTVYTGSGSDIVKLGAGDDSASLGAGNDICDGGAGSDTIFGEAGNDTIYGGDGDDTIADPSGANELHGGNGADTIVTNGSSKLYGDAGADKLFGLGGGVEIHGGTDNDELNGGSGNQKLFGDAGDDKLQGDYYSSDEGQDELHGGTGNDNLNGGKYADKLYGDAGSDTLTGGTGLDTMYGGSGNDILYGDGAKGESGDLLYGDAGNDKLYGQAGNDKIYGGTENDILVGGTGNDNLQGGAGFDTLWGETGTDILSGGFEADTFKFASIDGSIDTITDFEVEVDKISLPVAFTGSTLANYGATQSATDKLIYDAATGKLYADADANGSGAAVQFALLGTTIHPAITIADFVFA